MSSRVLRKLQGETDLAAELGVDHDSDPENNAEDPISSSSGAKKKQLNVNRYGLLNEQSLSESEVKEDDDNETEPNTQDKNGVQGGDGKCSSRRKKKKKKKKSLKPAVNQRSSEDNMESEDIDELQKIFGDQKPAASAETCIQERIKPLLSIEHRNLNPNHELKRIFGVKIVQSEQRKRMRTRSHLKVAGLVTPKETWPHVGKQGITMRYVEQQQGNVQMFAYEHSNSYQAVQRDFLAAVESLDPNNVVAILNAHPYHVDALLQLSDLCRMSEDLPMAADLVERALYALECAFHPLFNVAQSNCRLDYRLQENRSLFIVLFKHLSYVGQRACHRTTLELCKVLMSLDPLGDPLAMVLVVDLYALRSRQYEWLVRLTNEWESTRNLSQLPNFAFSTAVAKFYVGDLEEADKALQYALIMFPGVLTRLLEKCSVQTDAKVNAHSFFGPKSQISMPPALAQLVALYVARAWPVWKEAELLPWLERNTHVVLERVDAKDPLVAECEVHRCRRYQGTPPRNITRHILLADLKDVPPAIVQDVRELTLMNLRRYRRDSCKRHLPCSGPTYAKEVIKRCPKDVQGGSMMSFDPLPPVDSINLYQRPLRPRDQSASNSGALSMFFRSLLPSFRVQDMANLAQEDGLDMHAPFEVPDMNEAEGAVGLNEVRQSLTSLMDVLRDLLRNVQLPEAVEREDADVDSSGNEDDPAEANM